MNLTAACVFLKGRTKKKSPYRFGKLNYDLKCLRCNHFPLFQIHLHLYREMTNITVSLNNLTFRACLAL